MIIQNYKNSKVILIESHQLNISYFKKGMYICNRIGEMAEWSNAAVLKTVEGHASGGSNPSFSASTIPFLLYINSLGIFIFIFVRLLYGQILKSLKNQLQILI